MPEPSDPTGSIEEMVKRYQDVIAGVAKQSGLPAPLFEPLRVQADLMEQALKRQEQLEAQLTGAIKPLGDLLDAIAQTPESMRAQAVAFETAAASFTEAAKLLNVLAETLRGVLLAAKGLTNVAQPGGAG